MPKTHFAQIQCVHVILPRQHRQRLILLGITARRGIKVVWDQVVVVPRLVAFTGWVDPDKALTEYQGPALQGQRHVSFGGGNSNGRFTASRLSAVISSIKSGRVKSAGFESICFDVEECDAGLGPQFASAFAEAKAQGLGVWVTTSHSAPYGCSDGAELVKGWLQDTNLDFISPQLYTSGAEICADFEPNDQLSWDAWKSTAVKIVPSLPDASHYGLAYQWFQKGNLPLPVGYVQWSEVHAAGRIVV